MKQCYLIPKGYQQILYRFQTVLNIRTLVLQNYCREKILANFPHTKKVHTARSGDGIQNEDLAIFLLRITKTIDCFISSLIWDDTDFIKESQLSYKQFEIIFQNILNNIQFRSLGISGGWVLRAVLGGWFCLLRFLPKQMKHLAVVKFI